MESFVIDLSKRSRIKVSGVKSANFLNGVCSNDILNLKSGNCIQAAFLDRFAKVIAVSSISNFGDFFLVESDALAHHSLIKHISGLAEFSDCKVEDLAVEYKMFSVVGFESGMMRLEIEKGKAIKKKFNTKEIPVVWNALVDVVDFFVKTDESDGFPEFLYRGAGIGQNSEGFYDAFRILKGVPEYGKDYDSGYTVMELGLENLVSYTKGCYTGQEVVARMKTYDGQLPKKIAGMKVVSGFVSLKEKLFKENAEAGFVTSVAGSFAIGTLKKGFFDKGTEFKSESGAVLRVL